MKGGGSIAWAILAVAFNAFAWGVAWYPFRLLNDMGVHALWATALIYSLAVLVLCALKPQAWRIFAKHRGLWALCAASGLTNLGFNWGIAIGDVVRVVLCFYLMPLWSLLLAWAWFGDKPSNAAWAQVVLALVGMVMVLWPTDKLETLAFGLPEALGLLGGLSFAFTNLMLNRYASVASEGRSLSMFVGGAAFSGLIATALSFAGPVGLVGFPPLSFGPWVGWLLALAVFYLSANLSLQYGAGRLMPRVTALVLLSEVVFAAGSSWALGAASLTPQVLLGGALIVGAAALAASK